jgi:hypothetical protein
MLTVYVDYNIYMVYLYELCDYLSIISRYYKSKSGYINTTILEAHFVQEIFPAIVKRQKEFATVEGEIPTALLFLDGHSTRQHKKIWVIAAELKIDVHIFPSHTSHLLQPLDRCLFSFLKRYSF